MTKEIWRWARLVTGAGMVIVLTIANLIYQPKEHVHYHAGFLVYVDGIQQDYSGYEYMNTEKCMVHEVKRSTKEEQIEKAHLHDNVGDVVHVHRAGARWEDLLKNIGVSFPKDKMVVAYLNGELTKGFRKRKIQPYETLVIVVGTDKEQRLNERVERRHIEEVEAKSELCGN